MSSGPDADLARVKDRLGLSDEYWNRTAHQHKIQYALVRPLPDAAYSVDIAVSNLADFLAGQDRNLRGAGGWLEMDPDFQRGHVWSDEQQGKYVESVLRGQAPTRLIFNCPRYNGGHLPLPVDGDVGANVMQCVDGLQRTSALIGWSKGHVTAFGGMTINDFKGGPFDAARYRVQFVVYQFEHKRDLLQFYLDLNGGGVVHSKEELQRVRDLMESVTRAVGSREPDAAQAGGGREMATRPRG